MRISPSYIWATIIAFGAVLWMVSDDFIKNPNPKETASKENIEASGKQNSKNGPSLTVTAIKVKNEITPIIIRSTGVTKSLFEINVVARREGIVQNIIGQEGSWIETGNKLIYLNKGTLYDDLYAAEAELLAAKTHHEDIKKRFGKAGTHVIQLRSAEADLELNKKSYESTKELAIRGVQTELVLSEKLARYKAAEARLFELQNISKELELSNSLARIKKINASIAHIKEQLTFTTLVAPKSGWLEKILVEVGEFVNENRPIAQIIGLKELLLDMPIPQTSVDKIKIGDDVEVNFEGIKKTTGVVKKIASKANLSTRTFNIEVLLNNSDGTIKVGMSAEASIIIDRVPALKISPAHLNVNDEGVLTVKTIDGEGSVRTLSVKLIRTSGNFAYISGLSDNSLILTAGQAFLKEGEKAEYEILGAKN